MSYLYRLDQPDQPELWPRTDPHLKFTLKMHHASRLHFDFLLELDGLLLAWVLSEELSINPCVRQEAVHADDQTLDSWLTEGCIPKGQVDAGPELIADYGCYSPQTTLRTPHSHQVRSQLRMGRLTFRLHGMRYSGTWTLVREGDRWFLQKHWDEFASERPMPWDRRSVTTGRSLAEIAATSFRPPRPLVGDAWFLR
ncbi:MAG TPA: DNA polymerase ligase N-terminal domain-containing protein [Fimbriimonas sp.]|nr:DNA polymerase ligase N-terminal domain-containing protein [Fimbriimonas sp.]